MGGGRLVERKGAVDDRTHAAAFEQRPHFTLQRGRNRRLLFNRPRAQERPGDSETAAEYAPKVDGRLGAAQQANLYQTAIHRQRMKVAIEVVAAQDVEDQIDAAAISRCLDGRNEVFCSIVDRALGAEAFAGTAFFFRSGCYQHVSAARGSKLNGRRADTARPAMKQGALARPERPSVEHVGPDRKERLRNRRRVDQIESFRNGQALRRRSDAVFSVAASGHERAHAIAASPL
jgi:hypothetical protein